MFFVIHECFSTEFGVDQSTGHQNYMRSEIEHIPEESWSTSLYTGVNVVAHHAGTATRSRLETPEEGAFTLDIGLPSRGSSQRRSDLVCVQIYRSEVNL